MKNTTLLVLLSFIFVHYLSAQEYTYTGQELNAITTGVPFLTISPDARSGAFG
jgi:hypothetical protein